MTGAGLGIVERRAGGLYCPAGDFWIDPMGPVERAVVTHGHADHARGQRGAYLTAASGLAILKKRLGAGVALEGLAYGERRRLGGVTVSLHPAGHILGSAQVRIEAAAGICVVTGDHNASHAHPACEAYEAVRCDEFITECTFGLPIYRWPEPESEHDALAELVEAARAQGRPVVIGTYPLGKTQRILEAMARRGVGPLGVQGGGVAFLEAYRAAGIDVGPVVAVGAETVAAFKAGGLLLTGMAAEPPQWLRRLEAVRAGVSGWMQTRAARRAAALDRGFVISDHADWRGLLSAIEASGAQHIGLMHGDTRPLARYLEERGGWQVRSYA